MYFKFLLKHIKKKRTTTYSEKLNNLNVSMIAIFTEHQTLTLPQHEKQQLTKLFATEITDIYDVKVLTCENKRWQLRKDVSMCIFILTLSAGCFCQIQDTRSPWLGTSPLGKSHSNSYNYFWLNQHKIPMLYYSNYKTNTVSMALYSKSQNSENGPFWTETENYFKTSLMCKLFLLQRS